MARKLNDNFRCAPGCSVEATLSVLDGKWKGVILFHLLERTLRFNEIRRLLPSITQRMLTLQLRGLETDGLISRKVYPQIPPKVEYRLTDYGLTLKPIILAMQQWGQEYFQGDRSKLDVG
ncbi:MAG: helix-turn-helix domain-containing protein [Acidithiobacillus sp.]